MTIVETPVEAEELIEYVGADGTVTTLSSWSTVHYLSGRTGWLMPPVEVTTQRNINGAGDRFTSVRHQGRIWTIELALRGENAIDLLERYRTIVRALDPLNGVGRLRITSVDGTRRELACLYVSGLEGDRTRVGRWWLQAAVSFRAADPYWYDVTPTGVVFTKGTPRRFFPFPPMRLGGSSQIGRQEIVNPGDVETWPIWTLVAPFTRVELINELTGRTLIAELPASTGFLTIDTRPNGKTVLDDAGIDRYGAVAGDAASSMWSLAKGRQTVQMIVSGAQTGITRIEAFYFPRYLTP